MIKIECDEDQKYYFVDRVNHYLYLLDRSLEKEQRVLFKWIVLSDYDPPQVPNAELISQMMRSKFADTLNKDQLRIYTMYLYWLKITKAVWQEWVAEY